MTSTSWTLLAVAAACALVDWYAVAADRRRVEYLFKPATLVALIGVALALDPADDAVRVWFVAALVFSLGGDVLLMLPRNLFVSGLATFLVGHVCYVVGLQVAGMTAVAFLIGLALVAVALVVVGTPLVRAVRAGPKPALAGPVLAYMAVISLMVASAIGTLLALAIVGSALFYVSDASLGWNRFVRPLPQGRLIVMTTYHLGQAGLVLSLAT